MNDLTFAQPWWLALLPLVAVALAGWTWTTSRARRRSRALSRVPAPRPPLLAAILVSLAAASGVLAAAQPRWGHEERQTPRRSADLVVVIDISRSMAATDVAPNRLEAAKAAITATFERAAGDRVALVVFGGTARVRFPLTTDIEAAIQVVTTLETGSVLVAPGSSVTAGLEAARGLLEDQETAGGKLVLLVTDGDDLAGEAGLGPAAASLRAVGIELMVAGVGTADGATVPVYDEGRRQFVPKLGSDGRPVISRLNETVLRLVARAGEGRYLGANPASIPGAVSGRMANIKHVRAQSASTEAPIERYQWFAGAALALLCLGIVAERLRLPARRSLLVPATGVLVLVMAGCATRAHSLNEKGREAFARGDYEAAITHFSDAAAEEPDSARVTLNLAAAFHAAGRYDDAARTARRVLLSPERGVQARGFASLGHHLFAAEQLEESLDAFRQALLRNPADHASRHDYEVVLALLTGQQPGGQGDPSQGQGEDGEPTGPTTGPTPPGGGPGEPSGEGSPQEGPPGDAQALNRAIAELDRRIQALLDEFGPELTAAEAREILELEAERARLAALRSLYGGEDNPGDY